MRPTRLRPDRTRGLPDASIRLRALRERDPLRGLELSGLLLAARLRAGRTHDAPVVPVGDDVSYEVAGVDGPAVALPQCVMGMQLGAPRGGGCDLVPVVPLDPGPARRRPARCDRRVVPRRGEQATPRAPAGSTAAARRRRGGRGRRHPRVRPGVPPRRARPDRTPRWGRDAGPGRGRPRPPRRTAPAARRAFPDAAREPPPRGRSPLLASSRRRDRRHRHRSGPSSATNASTTARRYGATTPATSDRGTRRASSPPTHGPTRTRTGPRRSPTTCTSSTWSTPPPTTGCSAPSGRWTTSSPYPPVPRSPTSSTLAPHRRCCRRHRRHRRLAPPVPGPAHRRRIDKLAYVHACVTAGRPDPPTR